VYLWRGAGGEDWNKSVRAAVKGGEVGDTPLTKRERKEDGGADGEWENTTIGNSAFGTGSQEVSVGLTDKARLGTTGIQE